MPIKKYRLISDLPELKAGAIFISHGDDYYCDDYDFMQDCIRDDFKSSRRVVYYYAEVIENNPDWFRKEETL